MTYDRRRAGGNELIALVGDFNKGPRAGPPPEHPTIEAPLDAGSHLVDAYLLDVLDIGPRPGPSRRARSATDSIASSSP